MQGQFIGHVFIGNNLFPESYCSILLVMLRSLILYALSALFFILRRALIILEIIFGTPCLHLLSRLHHARSTVLLHYPVVVIAVLSPQTYLISESINPVARPRSWVSSQDCDDHDRVMEQIPLSIVCVSIFAILG